MLHYKTRSPHSKKHGLLIWTIPRGNTNSSVISLQTFILADLKQWDGSHFQIRNSLNTDFSKYLFKFAVYLSSGCLVLRFFQFPVELLPLILLFLLHQNGGIELRCNFYSFSSKAHTHYKSPSSDELTEQSVLLQQSWNKRAVVPFQRFGVGSATISH